MLQLTSFFIFNSVIHRIAFYKIVVCYGNENKGQLFMYATNVYENSLEMELSFRY